MSEETKSPEVQNLEANIAAFRASVERMEAQPDKSAVVLAQEKATLAQLEKRLANLQTTAPIQT